MGRTVTRWDSGWIRGIHPPRSGLYWLRRTCKGRDLLVWVRVVPHHLNRRCWPEWQGFDSFSPDDSAWERWCPAFIWSGPIEPPALDGSGFRDDPQEEP